MGPDKNAIIYRAALLANDVGIKNITLKRLANDLNISQENGNHLMRTFRSFLEGFALLVNNNAFGNPISINDSFELSLKVLMAGVKTLEMANS